MCFTAHYFFISICDNLLCKKGIFNMKKLNILSIAALSMVIGLLGGCDTGKGKDDPVTPPDPVVPDEFKEVSYEDYMAALEGKNFNDAPYKKCLINGTVKEYGESEVLASFADEPVRFTDGMSRPLPRPQYSKDVNTYAMSIVMSFATYWSSDEEGIVLYLNKGNKETPYMVKAQEPVAEGVWATTSYVYNAYGVAVSVKSVVNGTVDPLVFNAVDYKEIKDLTFTWLEKDMIDSYENIGYTAFHAKALEFEAADCDYQSGHASGTVGYCNSETTVTLENDVLIPGSERFESVSHFSELVEVFHNRASSTPEYDTYYFYYSESLNSLMAIMNMASGSTVVERVIVWNNNGLPISVKDTKYGNCEIFGSMRVYDVTLSYSKDAATVTLTVLPGLGTWSDGSTSKTITVNVGAYLGTAMAGFDFPTCEGMTRRDSFLARQDGRLIHYGVKLVDDLTLIVPFYNGSGAPNILRFTDPSSVQIDLVGYTSSTPIIIYSTDGSNDGFYFQSGAKQTISYTFKETKAPASTKELYVYGANISLGNADGPFIKSNCALSSLTLNEKASVLDYAFAYTCVESVSFQGSTLSSIGSHAFAHCEYLTNFYCGRITSIGDHAFAHSGLFGLFTSAMYSDVIGEAAFDECGDLYGVVVDYTNLEYKEDYQWNRFIKNKQIAPVEWDANWNGDAKIVYELSEEDFYHGEDAIPITGAVGGPSGEDTIAFVYSFPYSETETYSLYVAAYADNKVTLMQSDLTVIQEVAAPNYEQTVTGIPGGEYIIIEMYGAESINSNEYLIHL